jgi:hypothetical protein
LATAVGNKYQLLMRDICTASVAAPQLPRGLSVTRGGYLSGDAMMSPVSGIKHCGALYGKRTHRTREKYVIAGGFKYKTQELLVEEALRTCQWNIWGRIFRECN